MDMKVRIVNRLVVFTDLDGTLLDHDDYSFEAARPALAQLEAQNIPVILTTSKTATEVLSLRREVDNHHPFIVENGGTIVIPKGYFQQATLPHAANEDAEFIYYQLVTSYREILCLLHALRDEYGFKFTGFADMRATELAQETGLSLDYAILAKRRDSTEPIKWQGDEASLQLLKEKLAEYNLNIVQGGRFMHVRANVDKSDGVEILLDAFRQEYPNTDWTSIGLGDGGNDVGMLNLVDQAVVVRPKHGRPLPVVDNPNCLITEAPGPEGWNNAMLTLLKEYEPENVS
jgi:mannosyl-3-phosphoglycerate phosphatase